VKKGIRPFQPAKPDSREEPWRMMQADVERLREFRKCIECWLCQDVWHVLRENHLFDRYIGPRFFVETAYLEMHPMDSGDRIL
jgi:succinate dehydrogenase / fumarate reductase iron-sulfur subunit